VTSGDGNIAANAADLSRLATLLLGDGEIDGRRVCSSDALRRMTTPTARGGEPIETFEGLPPVDESTYGLGIDVERVAGDTCVTHGGGMVGYSTFILVDQTAEVGVVVLTNANGENLYAQLLARAAHADLLGLGRDVFAEPGPPKPGTFLRQGSSATSDALIFRGGADSAAFVDYAGATGTVYPTLTGRYVTDHPVLRTFHLDFAEDDGVGRWTHGPDVWLAEAQGTGSAQSPSELQAALVGRYRTYSPWFPTFRIVWRDGELLLVAPGGVEAPSEEESLVEVAPGIFRVGSDPWLPERLTVGPVVDGRAISVSLDGCVFSRTGD
jgi:hypothetical protein